MGHLVGNERMEAEGIQKASGDAYRNTVTQPGATQPGATHSQPGAYAPQFE